MIDVRFDAAELRKIEQTLERLSPMKRPQVYMGAMRKACETMKNALVKNISGRILKVRTGHLRRSMQYNISVEGSDFIGRVGSNVGIGAPVKYDAYLEDGTRRMKAFKHKEITRDETQAKVKADFIRFIQGLARGHK